MGGRRARRIVLIAATVVLATAVGSRLAGAGRAPLTLRAPANWIFQGRVYEGNVGDEPPAAQPLGGVLVAIYGGNDPYPEPGEFIASTTTDDQGWYGLEAPEGYEFYHIREMDPEGYGSNGATTVDGLVRTDNWIEYSHPLEGKTLTGNKFYDEPAGLLFEDTFEDGNADGWQLDEGWEVVHDEEGGEFVLMGTGPAWATPEVGGLADYELTTRFRLVSGTFHINFRLSQEIVNETDWVQKRYILGFFEDRMYVKKQIGPEIYDLYAETIPFSLGDWHVVRLRLVGTAIEVEVDGMMAATISDGLTVIDAEDPLLFGGFAYEALTASVVTIGDLWAIGPLLEPSLPDYTWHRTGGPSGGLGYDVRMHPEGSEIMFVTDNPSGVNKSYDGGKTWEQRNEGISARTGSTLEEIPIFSLTIDPSSPHIVWAGTQNVKGIFKSVDGGETWQKKVNGVTEGNEISFRNFGIHPTNSNIVFAGAEIRTGSTGVAFDQSKGKIYKSTNGGDSWRAVWSGDSLVRFVLFDTHNPQTMYASTGIFDREAWKDNTAPAAGEGMLKSTNGGENWDPINNGIPVQDGNRFLGFLEMHPTNPQILFAAAGNNTWGNGGVFRTTNGGASWQKVLGNTAYPDVYTVVVISPSDPDVVYAGSAQAVYRSDEGGDAGTWQKFWKGQEQHAWGPPGIRAGVPIGAVVDPADPMTIFINNYQGGNFKSTDGGQTWTNASKGYTGAKLADVAVNPNNPAAVYTVGRSGPFRSTNAGKDWSGLASGPARFVEWYAVALNPQNPQEMLVADEHDGAILKSTDGGRNWEEVFNHPSAGFGCTAGTQWCHDGFRALAYAPSNPNVVYGGMSAERRNIGGPFTVKRASYGMYKSTHGGIDGTWVQINNGLPPTREGSLLNIFAIAVEPVDPDVAYIGTWKDGIYKTTDGGDSWVPMNNGLTSLEVHALAIDPSEPETVYAGLGEGKGIFKSTTAGAQWNPINTGLTLECPSYLLPIGGGVEGVSFEQQPPDLSTQAYASVPWTAIWDIVIDPSESATVYAADNHSGVYLSTNGGATWAPINDNLTMKAVTALDISADGSVVYAATWGGGIFRLGDVEVRTIYLPLVVRNN